jgi:hypothetical protein
MSGRRLGAALALGVVFALAIDLLLQVVLGATRIEPSTLHVMAAITTKCLWLVAALLSAVVAPSLFSIARARLEWPEVFRIAGGTLIAAPVVWTMAMLMVFVLRLTFTHAWETDGPMLMQSAFYSQLVTTNGPWLLAGAVLRGLSSHLELK